MTQIKAHLMEKNIATDRSQVTLLVLAGWTKKSFGHYAILQHVKCVYPLNNFVCTNMATAQLGLFT